MKTRKFLPRIVPLLGLLTLNFAAVSQEVKVGVILPKKNHVIEANISKVITELNEKCHPPFSFFEKWYYSNCDEAATQAIKAAGKQVKILFNDGCFYSIDGAIKGRQISRPYPISSNTGIDEIKKRLDEFCRTSKPLPISKSLPRYIINVPSILLHAEIPVDKQGNYLFEVRENVVAKLTQGDVVAEGTKDNRGRYKDDACKKSIQFAGEKQLVWYDWSQTKNWLCVTTNLSNVPEEIGEIHQLKFPQSPPVNTLSFYTQDFSPFSYKSAGVVGGPGADIIREICEQAKLKCDIKLDDNWKNAQKKVRNDKADGLFLIAWTKKRAKWLNFSPPLLTTQYGFFVRGSSKWQFENISSLEGKQVGTYGPSGTYRSLQKLVGGNQNVKIKQFPDTETALKNLVAGNIDTVYSNKEVAESFITRLPLLSQLRYVGKHKELKYYIGIRNNLNSKRFYNQLNVLIANGTIDKILTNHRMKPATQNQNVLRLGVQNQTGWIHRLLVRPATD